MPESKDTFDLYAALTTACSFRSLSGSEKECVDWFKETFSTWAWSTETLKVANERENLFFSKGNPKILFTTHLDVVDGPDEVFKCKLVDDRICGRGACDAKGAAIAMLSACDILLKKGLTDFGLLLVVGEEDDGIGARMAAESLKNRGIRYLINGEPTNGVLANRQFGAFDITFEFSGTAVHSGYRQFGVDANEKLFSFIYRLSSLTEEQKSSTGISSINWGLVSGGISAGTVSPYASVKACVRTSSNQHAESIALLSQIAGDCKAVLTFDCPPEDLFVPKGFQGEEMYFCSDIPNFAALETTNLMVGPGDILRAHTADEYVTMTELHAARDMYLALYETLTE